jgi:cysteine desulfurase
MPTSLATTAVDLASFAAHKSHGPKGVGALYTRRGVHIVAQIYGGPQEREHRGGTENVAAIAGFGVAAELARIWLTTDGAIQGAAQRDRFERALVSATEGVIHDASGAHAARGAYGTRLWNTTNIGFTRLEAEAIVLLLSERGVCVSAGAACSSGSLDPSPVLLAMNIPPELAHGSIRFSLSKDTTDEECQRAVEIITQSIHRLRQSSGSALPAS